MTSRELDERIDAIPGVYDADSQSQVKQLIRECIEAVTPQLEPEMDTYGDFWASDDAMKLRNTIQANIKQLLG